MYGEMMVYNNSYRKSGKRYRENHKKLGLCPYCNNKKGEKTINCDYHTKKKKVK